jgi:hypothetical protein
VSGGGRNDAAGTTTRDKGILGLFAFQPQDATVAVAAPNLWWPKRTPQMWRDFTLEKSVAAACKQQTKQLP